MPRYKKKKHNRLFNPPKKSVKKAKKNSYIDENIEMTPAKPPKKEKTKENIRVISGKKGQKTKKFKFFGFALAILFVIVLVFQTVMPAGVFQTLINLVATAGSGSYPIAVSGGETLSVVPMGNYYYVLTDTHISAYSSAGKQLFSQSHGFEKPVITASKAKALIYGVGSREYMIFDPSGLKNSAETENEIICGAVSDSGVYALVTYSSNYASQVNVYSKRHKEIYKWFSANDTVNNVALSSSGKKLAVSTYNSSSGVFNSKFNILNYKSATPEFTETYDNTLIYGIKDSNKSSVAVIKSNGVDFVKWHNKNVTPYTDDYTISFFRQSSSYNVAVFNRESDSTDNKIVLLSKSGKLKYTVKYSGAINDICVKGRNIYCLSDTGITVLDFEGNIKTVSVYGFGGVGLHVTSANVAVVVTDNEIFRVKTNEEG